MFGSIVSACCRFKQWAKSIGILDIDSLWGYWRTDTGVNGKLAVDDATGTRRLEGTSATKDDELIQSSFSISCWFKRNSGTSGAIVAREGTGGYVYFEVSTNKLKARFFQNATGANAQSDTANITTGAGTYHFGVATFDHTAKQITLYVDGDLQTLDVSQDGDYSAISDPSATTISNPFYTHNRSGTPTYPLLGAIDQLVYHSKVLTQTEVTELYNSGTGIKHRDLTGSETFYSSIAAWYDFDSPRNFGRESSQETHAVSLGGTGNFTIANADSGDVNFDTTDSFTYTSWVYVDSSNSGQEYFIGNTESGSTAGWNTMFDFSGTNRMRFWLISDGSNRLLTTTDDANTLPLDEWFHLAISYDGTHAGTGINFYVNGVNISHTPTEDTLDAIDSISSSGDFFIGGNSFKPICKVDQVNIYNAELSASTINSLYNSGVPLNYDELVLAGLDTNLVSHWDFNEQDNTIIGQDSHTNLNHLTPNSIAEADLVGGVKDARTQYAGMNVSGAELNITSDAFSFGADGTTGNEPAFTVSFWAKLDQLASVPWIGYGSSSSDLQWRIGTNVLSEIIWRVSDVDNSAYIQKIVNISSLNLTDVYHFVFVYNGNRTSGDLSMYIDNVAQSGTDSLSGSYTAMNSPATSKLFLGDKDNYIGWGVNTPFRGDAYNLSIWDKELTGGASSEIETLYNLGKDATLSDYTGSTANLISWYDFENSVLDPRGLGLDASRSLNDAVDIHTNKGLTLTGATDFDFYDVGGDLPFSISCWIKFDTITTSSHQNIMVMQSASGSFPWQWVFYQQGIGGTPYLALGLQSSPFDASGIHRYRTDITSSISTGQWYHIGAKYTGNTGDTDGGISIFIDGVKQTVTSNHVGSYTAMGDSNDTIEIGTPHSSFNQLDGVIDQLNLYSSAVDDTYFSGLYNGGIPFHYSDLSGESLDTNLISHYDFNDDADRWGDAHTSGNDLTPTNLTEDDIVDGVDRNLTVNGSPTVGPARETSLDLTENGIDSSNAVGGVVTGNIANQEAVNEWLDLSGNNYDFSQSTIANQPLAVENGIGTDPSINHFWEDGTQNLRQAGYNWENTDITVALWLKWYSTSSGTYKFAIGQWGSAGDKVWGIRYGTTGFQMSATPDGTNVTSTAQYTITDDTWYLFVGQFNKTSQTLKHWIYDTSGTLLDENESASLGADLHTGTVSNLTYGGSDVWEGATANAAIWTKLLSTSERNAVVSAMVEEVGL